MTAPVRLQLSRRAGFNLHALSLAANGLPAVNVARPTIMGNPFKIGAPSGYGFQDGGDPTPMIASMTRDQTLELYERLLDGVLSPEMHPAGHAWMKRFNRKIGGHPAEYIRRLRGKNLACHCRLDDQCHANILMNEANRPICEEV